MPSIAMEGRPNFHFARAVQIFTVKRLQADRQGASPSMVLCLIAAHQSQQEAAALKSVLPSRASTCVDAETPSNRPSASSVLIAPIRTVLTVIASCFAPGSSIRGGAQNSRPRPLSNALEFQGLPSRLTC